MCVSRRVPFFQCRLRVITETLELFHCVSVEERSITTERNSQFHGWWRNVCVCVCVQVEDLSLPERFDIEMDRVGRNTILDYF